MNPFEGSKQKRERIIPYAPLGETLAYNVKNKLRQTLSSEDFEALTKLKLEDPEIRNAFVDQYLKELSSAIDAGDDEKAVLNLEILAAGLNSLVPRSAGEKAHPGPGAQKESGVYKTYLGSGTRGQRILISPEYISGDRSQVYQWMFFPADEPAYSRDWQEGFKNLYGDRVVTYKSEFNPERPELYVPIRENIVGQCPCGSKKKYTECHGA